MDVKTAIETGDAVAPRELLAQDSVRANESIRWARITLFGLFSPVDSGALSFARYIEFFSPPAAQRRMTARTVRNRPAVSSICRGRQA
jgi:hypothetical protein